MYRFALFLLILASFSTLVPAQDLAPLPEKTEKKRFVLYAMLTENTPVQLSDGSKWEMDKGDTFPVVMYKELQTKIILQLAGASFMIKTDRVKVIEEKDLTEVQLASYRANVNNYLESRAKKWKTEQAK